MRGELRIAPQIRIGRVEIARYRRWQLFWPRRPRSPPTGYPYSWLAMFGPLEFRVRRRPMGFYPGRTAYSSVGLKLIVGAIIIAAYGVWTVASFVWERLHG